MMRRRTSILAESGDEPMTAGSTSAATITLEIAPNPLGPAARPP